MNTRKIANLTCRLLALYFAVIAFTSLVSFVPTLFGPDDALFFGAWSAVNTLVLASVALFLWRYAERTAFWLVPDPADVELGGLTYTQVQRLAFSVVGLVFVVQGVSELLQAAALSLSVPGITNSERAVSSAVKLILGVALLLGKDSLTGLLKRLEQNRIPQETKE